MKPTGKDNGPEIFAFRKWIESQALPDEKTRRGLCRIVESVGPAEGLSKAELMQVEGRLFSHPNKPMRLRRLVFVSVALVVLSVSGTIVVAREGYFAFLGLEYRRRQESSDHAFPQRKDAGSKVKRREVVQTVVEKQATPVVAPSDVTAGPPDRHAGVETASISTSEVRKRAPQAALQTPPSILPAPKGGLGVESEMIRSAMELAKSGRDLDAALRAVDAYEKMFPAGVLAKEARFVRIEVLLLLGRNRDALEVLDSMVLSAGGRETELLLLRAELAAQSNCMRAVVDFSSVLNRSTRDEYQERALFGRGVCYRALGLEGDSARDFQTYRDRYPTGRFIETIQEKK
ncbi:MAG: hypothetical protein SGI86_09350 [Deltaproteobacteria bacterium]|nr:hypothetical protein [Deltaproteobacteria bacterium]